MKDYPLILAYHRVCPKRVDSITNTPSQIRRHIWLLKLLGYRFTTLADWFGQRHRNKGRNVILTFDDGWRDNFEHAFPVLRDADVGATIFLISNYIGKETMPEGMSVGDGRVFLSIEQIKAMQANGIDFQSHTCNHQVLLEAEDDVLKKELWDSKLALEVLLGTPVIAICYPKSKVDARVAQAALDNGYKLGVVTNYQYQRSGSENDDLRIPRVGLYAKDGLFRFLAKLVRFYLRNFFA